MRARNLGRRLATKRRDFERQLGPEEIAKGWARVDSKLRRLGDTLTWFGIVSVGKKMAALGPVIVVENRETRYQAFGQIARMILAEIIGENLDQVVKVWLGCDPRSAATNGGANPENREPEAERDEADRLYEEVRSYLVENTYLLAEFRGVDGGCPSPNRSISASSSTSTRLSTTFR